MIPSLLLVLLAATANAPACPPARPSPELAAKIQRRLPLGGDETRIIRAQRTEHGCFTRVLLEASKGDRLRHYVAYVSPDERFLVTGLTDLEAERDAESERLEKDLLEVPPVFAYGRNDAPVRIDVFSDFQCPYCGGAAKRLKELVDTTEGVRLVFRHFPLPNHPWALPAARASVCANDVAPGTFWRLHDFYFVNQSSFQEEAVLGSTRDYLKGIDVPLEKYDTCMQGVRAAERVLEDRRLGAWLGVTGTPAIFANGKKIGNPQTVEALRAAIAKATGIELKPVAE